LRGAAASHLPQEHKFQARNPAVSEFFSGKHINVVVYNWLTQIQIFGFKFYVRIHNLIICKSFENEKWIKTKAKLGATVIKMLQR
jgi:hypothetical protein